MEIKEVELRIEYADGSVFVGDFISLRDAIAEMKERFRKYAISDVRIIPVYKYGVNHG